MLLNDKVAIVTGGGSGIGEATSIRFSREGAAVIVADMRFRKAAVSYTHLTLPTILHV